MSYMRRKERPLFLLPRSQGPRQSCWPWGSFLYVHIFNRVDLRGVGRKVIEVQTGLGGEITYPIFRTIESW